LTKFFIVFLVSISTIGINFTTGFYFILVLVLVLIDTSVQSTLLMPPSLKLSNHANARVGMAITLKILKPAIMSKYA
jgi:hypothetical protein